MVDIIIIVFSIIIGVSYICVEYYRYLLQKKRLEFSQEKTLKDIQEYDSSPTNEVALDRAAKTIQEYKQKEIQDLLNSKDSN